MKKLALLLLLTLGLSCSTQEKRSQMAPTGSNLIGGSFEMENQYGKSVTQKDFLGQYTLVFFGFTSCQTVCPLGLSTMGKVLAKLPEKLSSQIQPIFVTVDPQRDTNQKNAKFVKIFHKRFIALRGTLDNTKDMVMKYRGYYTKIDQKDKNDYMMDHSDIIYLMDKKGQYLAHFSSASGVDKIVKIIKNKI